MKELEIKETITRHEEFNRQQLVFNKAQVKLNIFIWTFIGILVIYNIVLTAVLNAYISHK